MSKALQKQPDAGQTFLSMVDDLITMFEIIETASEQDRELVRLEMERLVTTELSKKVDGIGHMIKQRVAGEVALMEDFKRAADKKILYWKNVETSLRNLVKYGLVKLNADSVKGSLYSFTISSGRESLVITDEKAVPSQYKEVSVTMNLALWDAAIQSWPANVLQTVTTGSKQVLYLDKESIKKALKDKVEIPGAELKGGDDILTIR